MCNGKFSEQSEEVTRDHMLPKNGVFSKRWRRTSVDLHTISDYVPAKVYIPLVLMGIIYTYD